MAENAKSKASGRRGAVIDPRVNTLEGVIPVPTQEELNLANQGIMTEDKEHSGAPDDPNQPTPDSVPPDGVPVGYTNDIGGIHPVPTQDELNKANQGIQVEDKEASGAPDDPNQPTPPDPEPPVTTRGGEGDDTVTGRRDDTARSSSPSPTSTADVDTPKRADVVDKDKALGADKPSGGYTTR